MNVADSNGWVGAIFTGAGHSSILAGLKLRKYTQFRTICKEKIAYFMLHSQKFCHFVAMFHQSLLILH